MRLIYGLIFVFVLSSCAHSGTVDDQTEDVAVSDPAVLPEVESYRTSDPKPPEVIDPELSVQNIPVEVNKDVEKWIDYFQGRGREHMLKYLGRSSRYADLMKRILRENQMPEDLIYLALIESGFSWQATSHASAVGYWQFIRGTAVRYGLKVDPYIDERRDPVLATQAAADYLKSLHALFDSWYLAMAAYNVGENRIKRELKKNYTRDYWVLVQRKRLPRETRNYVPKFIAAKLIGEDPVKYGFTDVQWEPAIEFDQITLNHHVDLKGFAERMGMDYEDMRKLNPKFRTSVAPMDGGSVELRIPPATKESALIAAEASRLATVNVAGVSDTIRYRVQRGDTLSEIAERYRTSISRLRQMNNMSRRSVLRAGSRISVPGRGVAGGGAGASIISSRTLSSDGHYTVQRGDNLTDIARAFGTSVEAIRNLNGMGEGGILPVGKRLRVKEVEAPATSTTGGGETSQHQIHVVRRGENLSLIARKYGVSIPDLQQMNGLSRRSMIYVGQKLRVGGVQANSNSSPRRRIHIVRQGDTLIHIANTYSVPMSEIAKVNEISNRGQILVGSKLLIPD